MDINTSNIVGRPPLTQTEIDGIFRKLEPHLRTGISCHKACQIAKIPKSTFYDLYDQNSEFAEKIDEVKNQFSVIVSSVVYQELCRIKAKQNLGNELNAQELKFIQWTAVSSTRTKEEFGRELDNTDERDNSAQKGLALLQRIVDEHERGARRTQMTIIKSNALDI